MKMQACNDHCEWRLPARNEASFAVRHIYEESFGVRTPGLSDSHSSITPKATCLLSMHTHIAHVHAELQASKWKCNPSFPSADRCCAVLHLVQRWKIFGIHKYADGQGKKETSKPARAGIIHGTQILLYRLGAFLLLYIFCQI